MKRVSETVLNLKVLSIEGDGYHLYIDAKINGHNAHLLVDTGASKTVFDKSRIVNFSEENKLVELDRLSTGLGTDSMRGHTIDIDEITLGNIMVKNYQGLALDLSHVNASYDKMGLEPIDGVLGSDILHEYNAIIDYKNKELTLEKI
ncbi:MAG: retroviral-like aspartic protease family protein [Sphingobacteriales bacterium JAD_PAG50586_3]|nr:MAG: retroviral-like aspartic protease family protein [Sphingobacteriales bacterium JAD_PAG50586_3]